MAAGYGEVLAALRRELEALRAEYIANGRGAEFDEFIDTLKAEGRYPFDT